VIIADCVTPLVVVPLTDSWAAGL
jgi:hypothetical protein